MAEVEGVLRIVREAFTISLYHFWERELVAKMHKKYNDLDAFAFLKQMGLDPKQTELTALRLTANVAKHSEGTSADALHKL